MKVHRIIAAAAITLGGPLAGAVASGVTASPAGAATQYAPEVTVPITTKTPNDIAVDPAGDVFVADGTLGIIKYTPGQGQVTLPFPNNLGVASAIGLDAAGDVFAGFTTYTLGQGSIWELPNGGTPRSLFTGLTEPSGIALDTSTTGWFSDLGVGTYFGGAGQGVFLFGPGAYSAIDSSVPVSGVAWDAAGATLYYTDHDNDTLYKGFGGYGAGAPVAVPTLNVPVGVAVDQAGDVFVGGMQIHELPAGGGEINLPFPPSSGTFGTFLFNPALDAAGDVFATDGQKVFELPVVPPNGTMSAETASGVPGTRVTVTSVTACPAQSSSLAVAFDDFNGNEAGKATVGIADSSKDWAVPFVIPPVNAGKYTIHAECFQQASGATFIDQNYAYLPFTVNSVGTAMTLGSSPAAPKFGDPVRLFASLTPTTTTNAVIGGTVVSYDGNTNIGTANALPNIFNGSSGASAGLTTSALTVGTHTITAKYSGNGTFTPSSATTTVTITKSPTVVTVAPATRSAHQYSAVVSVPPPSGRPAALIERAVPGVTVTFSVATLGGSTELCHAVTNFAGRAACSAAVPMLAMGDGSYTATFAGNAEYTGSSNVGRLS